MASALAACGGGGGGSTQPDSSGSSGGSGSGGGVFVNSPPTIQGSPGAGASTLTVGTAFQFTPTARDPDGQALTFSIANRPSWAQFDTATGRLSGTPTAAHVGSYAGITISVSDGIATASLAAFSLSVTAASAPPPPPPPPGNQAPTISGTPALAVTVGMAYLFRPLASDPEGQPLTFSIANRPAWANFNPATGELSGTPGPANVGQTTDIVISVTDGQASVSLPPFAITVADVATGSATLRWTPPTMNEDGSPLTDLRGYRVYYGTNSNDLGTVLELPNPGLTSAVVENLAPATWYFAVRAYNAASVESASSNIASKTIR